MYIDPTSEILFPIHRISRDEFYPVLNPKKKNQKSKKKTKLILETVVFVEKVHANNILPPNDQFVNSVYLDQNEPLV